MPSETPLSRIVETIVADTLSVMDEMDALNSAAASPAAYRERCRGIPDRIRSGRLKIAVIGVIKSGKSTLINALTQRELVKRGAGVMTAITTRIRKGRKNRASVFLKSWDEINSTLERCLDTFPMDGRKDEPEKPFDIRRKKDRAYLEHVFSVLEQAFPVTEQGIRPEILTFKHALDGFETCKDIVAADAECLCFEGREFDRHQAFTADPARAFYTRDVLLEVFGKTVDSRVEIADCQGADSTDPEQLSRVVSYIQSANLIIYCISSRTGLRQSDIGFLKLIRRLGLVKNLIFVNNCDLSEHESLEDLQQIQERIRGELRLFTPDPAIYSFSALFALFSSMEKRLLQRSRKRLVLWREDKEMAAFSAENARNFRNAFNARLDRHFHTLLVSNHLERLRMMVTDMAQKADLMSDVMDSDQDRRRITETRLTDIRENTTRLKSIVDNSMAAAVSGLKREIDSELTNAFSKDRIQIRKRVKAFIRRTPMDAAPFRPRIKELGLKKILFLMFQDFKRELDRYTVEVILPDIRAMVSQQEARIETYFQSLLDAYRIDLMAPARGMDLLTEEILSTQNAALTAVDMDAIKKILGLEFPSTLFSPRYTGRIRARALTGLGFHTLVHLFDMVIRKTRTFSFTPGFENAAKKIKNEIQASANHGITKVHEDLKSGYFMPLIRAATRDFEDKIQDRFSFYESLDRDMADLLSLKHAEKKEQQMKIDNIKKRLEKIRLDLDKISVEKPVGCA